MNIDSLALWRLLTGSSPDRKRCQSALLAIPEASFYTFDADPTATSADLEALEAGASLLLSVQSPTAKAMARNIHVSVEVVSSETNCCRIFNAKEVRVRMDPVVRMCGLPPKGKGGCTNTSHSTYKLQFKGSRLLIQTPSVSKATTKAFFSLPYLEVGHIPAAALELLATLQAPANVWRTVFGDTVPALQELSRESGRVPLLVQTSLPGASPHSTDQKPTILVKEDSPLSYDLLNDVDSLPGEGEEQKDDVSSDGDSGADPFANDDGIQDFLDSGKQTDLIGSSARLLGHKLGAASDFDSDMLGLAGLNFGNQDDPSVAASSLSLPRPYLDPPCPSAKDEDSIAKLSAKSSGALHKDSGLTYNIQQPVLRILQEMDLRIAALEKENARLKRRTEQANTTAVQAMRAAVSSLTQTKSASTFLKKAIARVKDEVLKAFVERDFPETVTLSRDLNALMHWKATVDGG